MSWCRVDGCEMVDASVTCPHPRCQLLGSAAGALPEFARPVPEFTRLVPEFTRPVPEFARPVPEFTCLVPEFTRLVPEFTRPPGPQALALLYRIANDPGIVAVMESHRWNVGLLSEMPPVSPPADPLINPLIDPLIDTPPCPAPRRLAQRHAPGKAPPATSRAPPIASLRVA
eukprot:1190121-Prorocentrum_minimum.AAC.1